MQRKQLNLKKHQTYSALQNKIVSFVPVNRNGWWIKFSLVNRSEILLMFVSMYTGQTFIRYFTDEEKAVDFINQVIELNPKKEVDITADP